jgi:hypothetical protein
MKKFSFLEPFWAQLASKLATNTIRTKKHSKFNRAVKSAEFYADFKTVEMFLFRKLSAEIHF